MFFQNVSLYTCATCLHPTVTTPSQSLVTAQKLCEPMAHRHLMHRPTEKGGGRREGRKRREVANLIVQSVGTVDKECQTTQHVVREARTNEQEAVQRTHTALG